MEKKYPIDDWSNYIPQMSNIQDRTGISIEWQKLWAEIENWYGDIKKHETGEQFLKRVQATYFVPADPEALTIADYENILTDQRRLVRRLDLLINGDAAAEQAELSDLVMQIEKFGLPAVKNPNYKGVRWVKASERLPVNRKWNYIFRQAGNSRSATIIYLDHVDNICEHMKLPIDNIEWLDESGQ